MSVEGPDDGVGEGLERLDRGVERVRHELLGVLLELAPLEVAEVVAGGEHGPGAGEHEAARVQVGDRLGERVEDLVIERPALGRVRDRQPDDVLGRFV